MTFYIAAAAAVAVYFLTAYRSASKSRQSFYLLFFQLLLQSETKLDEGKENIFFFSSSHLYVVWNKEVTKCWKIEKFWEISWKGGYLQCPELRLQLRQCFGIREGVSDRTLLSMLRFAVAAWISSRNSGYGNYHVMPWLSE